MQKRQSSERDPEVTPTLGFQSALAIVIGGVIGSGIFMKPAMMADALKSPWLLIAVWVGAGLITLFGAMSNAEVAAMYPETGGQFVFFKKMYGDFFAYLYGWASVAVFNTAGNASIAYVCAQYADYFLNIPKLATNIEQSIALRIPGIGTFYFLENLGIKLLTISILIMFTVLNYFSARQGGGVQRFLTVLKIAAIVLLVCCIIITPNGSLSQLADTHQIPQGWTLLGAIATAMAGAFWAYDGWNNLTFVAGEIKDPQRNIPRSLIIGLLVCIAIYVLLNLAFLYALPIADMAKSSFVAADAAAIPFGMYGAAIVSFLVIFSTLGAVNANVLSTARVTYALGQENKAFHWTGTMHQKYETPARALILNAVWASILTLSGGFDMLTEMLIFVSWFFYGMSVIGLFVLRVKRPNAVRPFRVWGYPILPAVFVLFTFTFLTITVLTDIQNYLEGRAQVVNSVFGILITLAGVPFYWWGRKR
jgi:basic amino acid/polyamine antiporter, APA family